MTEKSKNPKSQSFTERQAFDAMVRFLEVYYQETNSDDVGALLGDLQILEDGKTADPAAWEEWLKCLRAVENKPE